MVININININECFVYSWLKKKNIICDKNWDKGEDY